MTHIIRWIGTVSAAILIVVGAIGFADPAFASIPEICGNGGSGYCLNNWGGGGHGNPVKMYYGGTINDAFQVEQETLACNNGKATATCPLNVRGINPTGAEIFELLDPNNGLCLATNGNAQAVLGYCADLRGIGGDYGVTMLWYAGSGCNNGHQFYALNRYWTQTDGTWVWLESGNGLGNQAYFLRTGNNGSSTCWGATSG